MCETHLNVESILKGETFPYQHKNTDQNRKPGTLSVHDSTLL